VSSLQALIFFFHDHLVIKADKRTIAEGCVCRVPMMVMEYDDTEEYLKSFVVGSGIGQFEPDTTNIVSRCTSSSLFKRDSSPLSLAFSRSVPPSIPCGVFSLTPSLSHGLFIFKCVVEFFLSLSLSLSLSRRLFMCMSFTIIRVRNLHSVIHKWQRAPCTNFNCLVSALLKSGTGEPRHDIPCTPSQYV
jgi:hypothetical protein